MNSSHCQRAPRTRGLFGRLLLIFMALTVAIALSFIISFRFSNKGVHRKIIVQNFQQYATYIANEIGNPPNIDVAEKKSQKLGLHIAINGPNTSYKSSKQMLDFTTKRPSKRHHFIKVQKGPYTYIFSINKNIVERPLWPLIMALILSLLFVIISYYLVERMFRPLQGIKEAAAEYSQGNFNHTISYSGKNLFGELSSSIENMAQRIRRMLDAKQELLLAIAHELRTPITRAKLHLEFLEDSENKKKLGENLDEMSQQVNDILQSEQLKNNHNELQLEPTSINSLIQGVLNKYFNDDQNLHLHWPDDIETTVDPTKYSLVIKNLLSNALRYGQGHPVEVHLSQTQLSVINSGPPIPEEDIPHLTDPFYRVDKSRERRTGGVGLGLYLVQQILTAHGHRLEISSGDRTTFTISF